MKVCAALFLSVVAAQAFQVRVTYLANHGVLLDGGGTRILIDALFRDGIEPYARHSPTVQEQIETGKVPFDRISLALATHFHLDHWDAGSIARFLRSNPSAEFASTPDATAMMPSSLRPRVKAVWPSGRLNPAVESFRLEHGRTQNLGYRVTLGSKVLVHLGDADPSPVNFDALSSIGAADVAMVPTWWLANAEAIAFLQKWKPKNVIALHFGEANAAYENKIRTVWPSAWLCTRQGESRTY